MRVVHFVLSCVAVSGEPSIPLFSMFYKLISDGDWFTIAKWKDSISQPCYSFMLTSTYPKEGKSRFILVSAAMIPESPPLRDAKEAIKDSVSILSTNEVVQWKRMYENPTRAFTFPEGILAMGGLSPSYPVKAKAFVGKKRDDLVGSTSGRLQRCPAEDSAAEERDEEASSGERKGPLGSLQVRSLSDDDNDEDLESRLVRKRKAAPPSSPKQVPVPRDIRLRLQSASGQKAFHDTRTASELPPTGVKGSLSKHLRSSSLVSEPLLGSSNAPIEIPTTPSLLESGTKLLKLVLPVLPQLLRSPRSMLLGPVNPLIRKENEGLRGDLQTSQTVVAELQCRVVDAEHKLQEEKGVGAMLEQKERAWAREMVASTELKRQKELDSVSQEQLYTMYAEAYRDVGYLAGLKDGYAYSAQGLGRKETPLYNAKAKKRLSKLGKEFEGKTLALLEKILERPLMSIDDLKALVTPAGPSSPKSLSGDDSQ
ncbi:hypothetical protein Hdeb2414_s0024g00649041 [Helianthus debilis subsp. tardiflorus]